jgi:hypothetical protein
LQNFTDVSGLRFLFSSNRFIFKLSKKPSTMKAKIQLVMFMALFSYNAALAQPGSHTKQSTPQGVYYWEFLPHDHDPTGNTKYPLIVFLHGCGEIAYRSGGDCPPKTAYTSTPETELDKVLANGIPKNINNGSTNMCFTIDGVEQCFMVVSPQLNNGFTSTSWDPRKLDSFIEEIKAKYPSIDLKRIYLTGLSWGGIGTWKYSERHPDKLAAIIPISGNASGDPASLACNLSKLPVWAFHDDPDNQVATGGTTNMENRIKACSNYLTPSITLIKNYYEDGTTPKPTHSAWNIAYGSNPSPENTLTRVIVERPTPVISGTTVYSWLLSKARTALGPLVNVEADKTVTSSPATITATYSHPEAGSTISAFGWELLSTTATTTPTLANQTTPTISLGNLESGKKYTLRLTVTDNLGYKDTDEVIITANLPVNLPPTANAGADQQIQLPANSIVLTGSASDSDGTISTYNWAQTSGPIVTITNASSPTASVTELSQGTYVFRLTVTDDDGATAFDDVNVNVAGQPSSGSQTVWNSHEIALQSTSGQQGVVNSTDNSTQATIEFYESTDAGGVTQGALFTTFNPGAHPQAGSNLVTYWANGTGNVYPHAGKSTTGRGIESGEGNIPQPTGVFDLQLHPPNSNNLTVAAFIAPEAGEYWVSDVAVRRVLSTGTTSRLKVFNSTKLLIINLQATNNKDWVVTPTPVSVGNLIAGDKIYFAVDRDGTSYASDFTEIAWTITKFAANQAPVANAGNDIEIPITTSSVTLNGSGTDGDGVLASYSWTQVAGELVSIANAETQNPVISGYAAGSYTFRLTITDDDGATATDDVTLVVTNPAMATSWNSYDVVMQTLPSAQGVITSTDNTIQASMEFYESTDAGGVTKGTLFTTFNSGTHPQAGSNLSTYWANGAGNVYPHAGKSTTARGVESGEGNVPLPTGVFDLQLHPPNSGNLAVAAFIAPANGSYSITDVGVRRVLSTGTTSRLKVFNKDKVMVLDLQATNNKDWVISAGPHLLGNLVAGDRIYFAADRDGTSYASDFTEVTFTTSLNSNSGRLIQSAVKAPSADEELKISIYPNPVANTIHLNGVSGETGVRIYNSVGALCHESKVDQQNTSIELPEGSLMYGFYFMRLESEHGSQYLKFLKE